jgi:peptidoglycan/xylan/chitin deacetylase (PgdA/CDA1 family)
MHSGKKFDCDRYLSKLEEKNLVIFLFHGVVNDSVYEVRNYNNKHLLSQNFIDLIKALRSKGKALSMDDIVSFKEEKIGYPPYSYAITFDDGFKNNHEIAAPILDDYSTPATFYITTDFVNSNRMSWIDQIEYCFESVQSAYFFLPWSKEKKYVYDSKTKVACLEEIRKKVKSNPIKYLNDEFVSNIFIQFGVDLIKSNSNKIDQKMNWSDVFSLSKNNLFAIGGHTHSHASLAFLGDDEIESEINTSLRYLQDKANLTTTHYSYPEGTKVDYSEKVIESLKKNQIKCCPTAINGSNKKGTNLFHLRRITVV